MALTQKQAKEFGKRWGELNPWWRGSIPTAVRFLNMGEMGEGFFKSELGAAPDYDKAKQLVKDMVAAGVTFQDLQSNSEGTDFYGQMLAETGWAGTATAAPARPQAASPQSTPVAPVAQNVAVGDVVGAQEGLGRYGQGFVVTEGGMFHNISPEKLEELRAQGIAPLGVDPSLWTDAERIRARQMFDTGTAFNEYLDTKTGNKFVFKDGGLFAGSAVPAQGTPTFIGNNTTGGALVGSPEFEAASTVQAPPTQVTVAPPAQSVVAPPPPPPVTGGTGTPNPFPQTPEETLVVKEEPLVTKETLAIMGAVALVLVLAAVIFL